MSVNFVSYLLISFFLLIRCELHAQIVILPVLNSNNDQKMSSGNELKGDLAAKINFPVYGVEMLTDRHFVVAGGGGAAKTGVFNGFVCSIIT